MPLAPGDVLLYHRAGGGHKAGDRVVVLTVVFQHRDGSGEAFAYAHLYRIGFVGRGKLEAEFSGHVVTLEGRNLGRLLKYLCDHKVCQVWETDRTEFADDKSEVVESITVRPAKGS